MTLSGDNSRPSLALIDEPDDSVWSDLGPWADAGGGPVVSGRLGQYLDVSASWRDEYGDGLAVMIQGESFWSYVPGTGVEQGDDLHIGAVFYAGAEIRVAAFSPVVRTVADAVAWRSGILTIDAAPGADDAQELGDAEVVLERPGSRGRAATRISAAAITAAGDEPKPRRRRKAPDE